ncbi:MAG: Wzt carbohydrate-binding domain-containing protein [Acidobacteriales bacterium]|nr:Wzt carbohydrate-binding domain-containing protein [Terriglobales bacterium]
MAIELRDVEIPAGAVIGVVGENVEWEELRRAGASVMVASTDESVLLTSCDEVWWIRGGKLEARGAPRETLALYQREAVRGMRAEAEAGGRELAPSLRRGDGRARVVSIETLNADGRPVEVLQSGEPMSVRITVHFARAVEDPVVGMMIRSRIGVEVYGTNTELEKLKLGPCAAGDTLQVTFAFPCNLCPQHYTLTAASHDPDGVWHDWLEDAVRFTVTDARYTAGVANLRATASVAKLG